MKSNRKIKKTRTSSFGSPGRVGHNSTAFYESKLYESLPNEKNVEYVENYIPSQLIDKIFCKSSEKMAELPDDSIHLMVTSPPYNVGKEYDDDLTLEEYCVFLKRVGHPAPFPVELPYRLIQLYTFENEIILDPFIGSGQSAIAAIKSGRHYVGYDINEEYVKLAETRIKDFLFEFNSLRLFEDNLNGGTEKYEQ